jgi:hypothetical protein
MIEQPVDNGRQDGTHTHDGAAPVNPGGAILLGISGGVVLRLVLPNGAPIAPPGGGAVYAAGGIVPAAGSDQIRAAPDAGGAQNQGGR